MMGFNDPAHDGQTEARAFGFRGCEDGLEGALLLFLGHASAGVLERYGYLAAAEDCSFDGQRSTVGHYFDRIQYEIQESLFELGRISHDERQILRQNMLQLDALVG